jgi:hypothetical protein
MPGYHGSTFPRPSESQFTSLGVGNVTVPCHPLKNGNGYGSVGWHVAKATTALEIQGLKVPAEMPANAVFNELRLVKQSTDRVKLDSEESVRNLEAAAMP